MQSLPKLKTEINWTQDSQIYGVNGNTDFPVQPAGNKKKRRKNRE